MAILVDPSVPAGQQVIIPSRVIAALSQMEPAEQAAVQAALQDLGRAGVRALPGISAKKLETTDPLYVLYLDAAPEVLVLVRAPRQVPVEVVDIVRPQTLQSLFHTR